MDPTHVRTSVSMMYSRQKQKSNKNGGSSLQLCTGTTYTVSCVLMSEVSLQ